MKALQAFWPLLRGAPRGLAPALLAAMVLSGLTEGFGLMLLAPLLETMAGGGSGMPRSLAALDRLGLRPTLGGLLLLFLLLTALRGAVQVARDRLGSQLQHLAVDRLRARVFAAILDVEWRWLVNSERAGHASLLLSEVTRVGIGLHYGLALAATGVTFVAYLLAALTLSWSLTLAALAAGGLALRLGGRSRDAMALGQQLGAAHRALHGNVQESLAGIKLAKISGSESRHRALFEQVTEQLRTRQIAFAVGSSQSRALYQMGSAVLLAAFLYGGLQYWQVPAAVLLTLVLLFARLVPMVMQAQHQWHHVLHALPALEQAEALLAECRAHAEPPEAEPAGPAWPLEQAVRLQGVSLRYVGRTAPALDDVSLCFPARTTTAVIGASGAGKSTLADLLAGLLSPDQGELSVDGRPVDRAACRAWRRQVAYVAQDVFLFNDSIRHNLLWVAPQASEAELHSALARAAADFVHALPQGLDTPVGDGGMRLSGGERQRLALARALLRRPSLLILDEATSALDTDTEARVRQAIEALHGDLTVVVIGHRLPTLEHADQVVELAAGRVVAQGSWSDLRALRAGAAA